MAKNIGVTFSVGASLGKSVSAVFGTASSRVKSLRGDLASLRKASKAAGEVVSAKDNLSKARSAYALDPSKKLKAEVDMAQRALVKAEKAATRYGVGIANAGKAHTTATRRIMETEKALARQQKLMDNRAKRRELRGEVMGTVASVAAVAVPVKMAIDYESSFADLKKAADFVSKEQEELVKQDIFATAKKTGLSAAQITEIATSAAESGVVKNKDGTINREAMREFLNDAAQQAVAFGISAEEAGQRMKAFRTRMGLSAQQTREMADSINYMGANMNATADDISKVVSRMGGVGEMAGLSEKSTAALAAALVATSEAPEVAGTAFKNFVTTLSKSEAMTKKQKAVLASMGINPQLIAAQMKKGGAEAERAILGVLGSIKEMPEAEQAGIANLLFGTESLASLAPLINDLDKLEKAFDLANSSKASGSVLKEFETRSATTQGSIDRLRSSLGVTAITVGSTVLPAVVSLVDGLNRLIEPVTAYLTANPMVVSGAVALAGGLVAVKVASLAGGLGMTLFSDALIMGRRMLTPAIWLTRTLSTAMLGQARVTRIVTAATEVFNAVSKANPIGFIITAVSALVGWFGYLYHETGSVSGALGSMWDQCLTGLKTLAKPLEWTLEKIGSVMSWFSSGDDEKADKKADEQVASRREKAVSAASPVSESPSAGAAVPAASASMASPTANRSATNVPKPNARQTLDPTTQPKSSQARTVEDDEDEDDGGYIGSGRVSQRQRASIVAAQQARKSQEAPQAVSAPAPAVSAQPESDEDEDEDDGGYIGSGRVSQRQRASMVAAQRQQQAQATMPSASSSSPPPAMAQAPAGGGQSAASGPQSVQVTQHITVNAEIKELRKEVMQAIKDSSSELERILGGLLRDQASKTYG